jgi:hypothetical protein
MVVSWILFSVYSCINGNIGIFGRERTDKLTLDGRTHLTIGVDFTNILRVAFAPLFLCQKVLA